MTRTDLVLDAGHTPTLEEIAGYFDQTAAALWQDMDAFLRQEYRSAPKLAYSKCAGKPGWNVKYHKAGKALCTLYPERERFVALVVVTLDLADRLKAMAGEFAPAIRDTLAAARPFNGTLWLMIPVDGAPALVSLKQLLLLKHPVASTASPASN